MLIFTILLDGIAYGMVLFIISVGLTVTMGLMRVVNLAHGSFAMLGGYLSSVMIRHYDAPFIGGALIAAAVCGALGGLAELTVYRPLYRKGELAQVLLTFGMIFISIASMTLIFGTTPIAESMPKWLEGLVDLGFRTYPTYRLFLICVGALLALGLYFIIECSLFGARLRASVDDPGMARALGINVNLLFTLTFIGGCALAGFGGAIGAGILPIEPFYALRYLVLFLVVVVIGGLGSFRGSLAAALAVGLIETTGKYLMPQLGSFLLWFIVFGLLLWRPYGLLPPKSAT